jgi:hypothetical protein
MWKTNVEQGRPQMAVLCIRIACWIPKSTDTHSECVILIAFPLQQLSREPPQGYVTCTLPVLFTRTFRVPGSNLSLDICLFEGHDFLKKYSLKSGCHASKVAPASFTSFPTDCSLVILSLHATSSNSLGIYRVNKNSIL